MHQHFVQLLGFLSESSDELGQEEQVGIMRGGQGGPAIGTVVPGGQGAVAS